MTISQPPAAPVQKVGTGAEAKAAPAATETKAAPAAAKTTPAAAEAKTPASAAKAAPTPAEAKAPPAVAKTTPSPAVAKAPPAPAPAPTTAKAAPAASAAPLTPLEPPKLRLRHRLMLLSFVLVVLLPGIVGMSYLFLRAADQYHSRAAFSVRSESFSGALTTLAAFTQIGQTSAPESAVLYDYIRSQELMQQVDARLDLRHIFNLHPRDVVFSLGDEATTEDMLDYWQRMVRVTLDSNTNILNIEVHAFRPEDAVAISQAVIDNSADLVNQLSAIARDDTMRAASEDLTEAQDRMRDLSGQIRAFRDQNSIIDPAQGVQGQMGVLGALQGQLASALIEKETLLPQASGQNDPRLTVVDRKIAAIRNQIAEERARVREPDGDEQSMSTVIGQYEGLLVDLEFARTAYTAAMAAMEQARAEARRQSRYVAVHINPTLAQESLYPRRWILSGLLFLGLFAGWAVMALAYYNMRDRG